MFVDGEGYELGKQCAFAAALIAEKPILSWQELGSGLGDEVLPNMLTELYNRGCLRFAR